MEEAQPKEASQFQIMYSSCTLPEIHACGPEHNLLEEDHNDIYHSITPKHSCPNISVSNVTYVYCVSWRKEKYLLKNVG